MSTIYDVAKRAGVSIATVSAVLNKSKFVSSELTNRVQDAAAALDYQINHLARSVQLGSSRTVGMLIPSFETPDPFYAQVISGVEDVLNRSQYALLLGQSYNELGRQSRYLRAFRARLVDGILLFQNAGSIRSYANISTKKNLSSSSAGSRSIRKAMSRRPILPPAPVWE